jgi:acyl carrier protein
MVLDTLTRSRPLDFFVGFSSLTALIGSVGQANYSAGNLYVEALARARHDAGRPALAIAWAGISDVGYVARHGLRDSLSGMGLLFLSPDQVLEALAELLGLRGDVVGVGGIDWGRMSAVLPSATTPRLVDLLPPLIEGTEYRRDEFVRVLADASPEDARCLVEDSLVQVVAGILQSSPDRIDRSKRLTDMGMDSLMTVELVTSTSEQFQCNIPLAELANSAGTVRAIAELILGRLGVQGGGLNGEATIETPLRNPDPVASGRSRTTSEAATDVVVA